MAGVGRDFSKPEVLATLRSSPKDAADAEPCRTAIGRLRPLPGPLDRLGREVDGIDAANWQELNESPDKPLLNRPLRGAYPPGSTIKPFLALSALTSGKRTATQTSVGPTCRSYSAAARSELHRSSGTSRGRRFVRPGIRRPRTRDLRL